jgi:hypothetical protein
MGSDTDKVARWIAVISLLVSLAGTYYSSQQTRITSGSQKAFVQVFEAALVEPLPAASFVRVRIKLKNFGLTAATEVQGDFDYSEGMPGDEHNSATNRRLGAMAPGRDSTVVFQSNRRNMSRDIHPQYRLPPTYYFYGTVRYQDDTTGEQRQDVWCYQVNYRSEEDLKRTDLQPCDILQYSPKAREQ